MTSLKCSHFTLWHPLTNLLTLTITLHNIEHILLKMTLESVKMEMLSEICK